MSDIGGKFSWGLDTYNMEGYTIKKYHPYDDKTPFGIRGARLVDESKNLYHIYVDGKDTNVSTKTLEGAMLVAISTKKLGNHVPGLSMIARALNIKDEL